jgi:ketohexokinase
LGHRCEWAGVLVDEPSAGLIKADLARYEIGTRLCRRLAEGQMPVSYITLSRDSATRTIAHLRDLPEYDFESFRNIEYHEFDWIHFEGRNVGETLSMVQYLRDQTVCPRISLEVEKPRDGIEKLFTEVDLIVFSPAVAVHNACKPQQLLQRVAAIAPQAMLVCTLGAQGAIALDCSGELYQSGAFAPPVLVDTIAAGDTFNAAMIDRLLRGDQLRDALEFACRLAGRKCGQSGLDGLIVAGEFSCD